MLSPSAQLLYASWCGNTPTVRKLLAQGVPTEVKDGRGRTPLMLAAAARSAETVSLLLAAGADTSARNRGNRLLIDYVSDTAVAQQILAAIPTEQRSAAATRLLFNACGNPDLVKCALEAGANVNARNKRGDTPLTCHSWFFLTPEKSHACIRMLLAAGANPGSANCHQQSPMLLAVRQDDAEAIKLLLAAGVSANARLNDKGERPLHHVLSAEAARVLLAAGADVNAADTAGYTPLMTADGSNTALIRLLLQAGADPNACNASGSVLTHLSRRSNEVDLLLCTAGARYRADISDDVYHAIHDPCSCRLQQLIEDRPDIIHRVDPDTGYTPLLEAAWSGNTEALRILLTAGAAAGIDYRDAEEGVSALHASVIACRDSATAKPENVTALLSAGADTNLTDRDDWTPLHSCAHYNLPQIVPLLLKAGANTQLRDNHGATPEDIASANGHTEIVNLLRKGRNMGSTSKNIMNDARCTIFFLQSTLLSLTICAGL